MMKYEQIWNGRAGFSQVCGRYLAMIGIPLILVGCNEKEDVFEKRYVLTKIPGFESGDYLELSESDDPNQRYLGMANLIAMGGFPSPESAESDEERTVSEKPLQLLGDPSAKVRAISAFALSGREDPDSEARLIALLKDPSDPVRVEALTALGKRSDLSPTATENILGALENDNILVRLQALEALGKGCSKERSDTVAARLVVFMGSHEVPEKLATLSALGGLESKASEAALLETVRHSENDQFIDVAVAALTPMKSTSAEELVLEALEEGRGSPDVMLSFIAEAGTERSLDTLIARLNDEDDDIREMCVFALTDRGGERAREALIAALEALEKSVSVRLESPGAKSDPNVSGFHKLLKSIESLSGDLEPQRDTPKAIEDLLRSRKLHERLIGMRRLRNENRFDRKIPGSDPTPPEEDLLGALDPLAKDSSPIVRAFAMQSLARSVDPRAISLLSNGWDDDVFEVRLQALKGIADYALSTGDATEIQRLYALRESFTPSSYDENDAALTFRKEIEIGLAALTPSWVDLARDRRNLAPEATSVTRLLAAERLAAARDSEATSALISFLESGSDGERNYALNVLDGDTLKPEHLSRLSMIMEAETDGDRKEKLALLIDSLLNGKMK